MCPAWLPYGQRPPWNKIFPWMSALWTGIHPIWVHYWPGPIPTYRSEFYHPPPPGTTGVTHPTIRGYSPCQAKRPTALYTPEVPRSQAAQRCDPAYILQRPKWPFCFRCYHSLTWSVGTMLHWQISRLDTYSHFSSLRCDITMRCEVQFM